jgi:hypothetical protein
MMSATTPIGMLTKKIQRQRDAAGEDAAEDRADGHGDAGHGAEHAESSMYLIINSPND